MDRVEAAWNKKHSNAATAQLYLGPEDEDDHKIYMLPARNQNVFSSHSTGVYDNRDDIIDRLHQQVDQLLQSSRHSEPARNNDFHRDGYLASQSRNLASLGDTMGSHDQFAATRSGKQSARDEDFQEV